ncbi:MAG: hypothetical protein R3C52_15225 [Hyphomonadaceae bacterium]
MRGIRLMGSWVLALFLAVMFLWIADVMAFPATAAKNVVFPSLVEASGIALWEPTGRAFTSLLHVIAALLLLIPLTRRAGAILAFLVSLAAVLAQVLWLGLSVPQEIGSAESDGGQLFYLSLALLAASLLLIFVHPGRAKG